MIWEELGDIYEYSNIPSYFERKAEILDLVSRHDDVTSWNNETLEVQVGQSITLDDSNGLLSSMAMTSNSTSASIEHNGNTLTITPTADSNDGVISFQMYPDFDLGTSILYNKPGEQKIIEFHLEHNVFASINLKVIKLGNVQVQKIDEDTGKPLAGAIIRFIYDGNQVDVVTDSNGFAKLHDLPQGTQVTITELLAPDGFYNKAIQQTVTIEPNNTVQVILRNKAQMGVLNLTKLGNKAVNLKQAESDFGDIYSFGYGYRPLAGVTYDIVATEDIRIADNIKSKAGDVVATVTTDDNGNLMNVPHLYLGKYQAVEQSALFGYVIAPTPLPFGFTYQGQEVELVRSSLEAKNKSQSLKFTLLKQEEQITSWSGNKPVIEEVPANDKVFGLYTNEEFQLEQDVTLPKDSLLYVGTVKDGSLLVDDLDLPKGDYYFKELDSGEHHKMLDDHFEFTYTAEDNNKVKEIIISEDGGLPLLNELYFNQLVLRKTEEQATLDEKQGYTFEFIDSCGSIFSLED